MTWEIFLGIVALIGFAVSVGTPILKLNTNIVKLNSSIDSLKDSIGNIDKKNTEEHAELWKHNDEQDTKINGLTDRVGKIETDIKIATTLHPELIKRADK